MSKKFELQLHILVACTGGKYKLKPLPKEEWFAKEIDIWFKSTLILITSGKLMPRWSMENGNFEAKTYI